MTTQKTNPGNYFEDFTVGQELVHTSPRTVTSPTGPGRVAPAAPTPPHVESDPHMALDRKQTSGAWTTGSSSATTAGRSGC